MRLRSIEISNSKKAESDSSLVDFDAVDEKMVSSNLGFQPLLNGIVEKKVKKTEIDLEVGVFKEEESIIMKDKSFIKGKKHKGNVIKREADDCFLVKCVTVPFIEGKDLELLDKNNLNSSLKKESIVDDDYKVSLNVLDDSLDNEANIGVKKGKKGRKRKTLVTSECSGDTKGKKEKLEKGGARKSGRLLRSKPLTNNGLDENLVGFKRKMEAECLNQTEVNEKSQPTKKHKNPGRPPKAKGQFPPVQHVTDDVASSKKLKRDGRPPIMENKDKLSKPLTNEKKSEGDVGKKVKNQLVRDKIVNMVLKAGWTVEHRPRNGREYLDAVYVDLKGGTHWSVTKAYYSIKKRIEESKADEREVSAFTPLPEEELSILFRTVTKVRSDKDQQKKRKGKKKDKGLSKGKIVINDGSEGPPKKKVKDGKKKKKGVKLGDNTVKRQSRVSQKSQQSRKPRLLARSSNKDDEEDGIPIYNGKRNLLSWMVDLGVIMPGGKIQYNEGRTRNGLLEGKVTCDGVHCNCCNKTMDISSFVSHGVKGKVDQSLKNLNFQSGLSFLKCLQESWKKEVDKNDIKYNLVDVNGGDPNDDTCNICGDGGDLICCDGCPSTFHQSCLDIKNFPDGDWHCVYCCCKFCGDSHDKPQMISCCLCEEKFHGSCVQEDNAPNLDSSDLSFCGRKCQEIFEKVQTYIGVKYELEDGFSWTLLQRADVSKDPEKIECNSRLAVAFSVMDECFVPVMDERSGVNVIHDVVYNCGSNLRRLDYSGFFTAILEKGDELICAASIRIHGNRLAEMPFIGTRHMYRRQGMCRRLLDAIESALGSLGVGELVIPAIPELYKTWTKVFGFKPLKKSKRQAMKSISMVVFPGLDILQKSLPNNHFADKNLVPAGGVGCITVENDDNAPHSETESPTISFQVPEATDTEIPLVHVSSDSDVQSPDEFPCDHKMAIIKNTFDLNLRPAVTDTDTDIQSNDQDSFMRDPQVCNA